MADTLERTETDIDLEALFNEESEDVSNIRHFFRKEDMDEQLLTGKAITALCGFIKTDLANPAAGGDVCPKCVFIYDNIVGTNLPNGGK